MSGSLRIAHIGDTHLGYRALYKTDPVTGRNQRTIDAELGYSRVIDRILDEDVDLVIHAGDVFHHTRPNYATMRHFIHETRRLTSAGLPVYVIAGNHDTPRLRTTESVFSVLESSLDGVTFVTGYEDRELHLERFNLYLAMLPHGKLVDAVRPTYSPPKGMRSILVTHGTVQGLKIHGRYEVGEVEIDNDLLMGAFDYIALGHYHAHSRQRENAWYSGSTERIGWGDEPTEPGFALVELYDPGEAPNVEHPEIRARTMKTLHPIDGADWSARDIATKILEQASAVRDRGAMVRVELKNTPRPVRREAESIVRREHEDLVWSLQVYTAADVLAAFQERRGDVATTDLRQLFAEYIQQRIAENAMTPAFAEAFGERGLRAIEDAQLAMEMTVPEDAAS